MSSSSSRLRTTRRPSSARTAPPACACDLPDLALNIACAVLIRGARLCVTYDGRDPATVGNRVVECDLIDGAVTLVVPNAFREAIEDELFQHRTCCLHDYRFRVKGRDIDPAIVKAITCNHSTRQGPTPEHYRSTN